MPALTNAERPRRWRNRRALEQVERELGMPTIEQLRAHVEQLCQRHGIRRLGLVFNEYTRQRAAAEPETKSVWLPGIRSERAYISALHEIGHCVTRQGQKSALAMEIAAWRWARAHSLVWTKDIADYAIKAIRTYAVHDTALHNLVVYETNRRYALAQVLGL